MQGANMQIENVKIKDLNPAKYNPRKINDKQLEGLRNSIRTFGLIDPIIVNKKGNTIIGGHMRTRAAELEGHETVPVVYVDLSPAEEKALNVALNSHTISGEYDMDILPSLLEEIKLELPDMFDDLNFEDFVIDNENINEIDLPDLGDGSDPDIQQCTFTLSNEQKDIVNDAMNKAKSELDCTDEINQNSNGNKLAAIMRWYLGS